MSEMSSNGEQNFHIPLGSSSEIKKNESPRPDGLVRVREVAPHTEVEVHFRDQPWSYDGPPKATVKEIRDTKQPGNPQVFLDWGPKAIIGGGTFVKPLS